LINLLRVVAGSVAMIGYYGRQTIPNGSFRTHDVHLPIAPLLGIYRAPFLLLMPVNVSLGAAAAYAAGAVHLGRLGLALLGALAAHAAVNALNEYADFRSGLDLHTRRTPFSGGSGVLPANPALVGLALSAGVAASLVAIAIGLYLVATVGAGLLPVGLLGLALVYGYTPWINRHPWLCLLAPGLGVGPLVVLGTYYVLAGHYSLQAVVASLPSLFLGSGLLLLNQFPDLEADRAAGRRHFPIVIGRPASAALFAGLVAATYLSVALGWAAGVLPDLALLAWLPAPLALPLLRGVRRHADAPERLTPYLALNVVLVLVTPLLLALGIALG